jgi:hypothetical protein
MISDETRAKEIVKKLRKCNFEQEQEFILKGVYDSDPLMKTANRRALIAIAVSVTSSIIALLSFLN